MTIIYLAAFAILIHCSILSIAREFEDDPTAIDLRKVFTLQNLVGLLGLIGMVLFVYVILTPFL